MKVFLKGISLIAVGLAAALIGYPFLHETGHALATAIAREEVCDIQLWPMPTTMCQVDPRDLKQVIGIGFGGIMLPFLITAVRPPKHFIAWYLWAAIKGICILSFVLSFWSIIFYKTKFGIATDDMTIVMQFAPNQKLLYLLIIAVLTAIELRQLARSHPMKRCMKYFDAE